MNDSDVEGARRTRAIRLIRAGLVLAGACMIVFALIVDFTRWGNRGSFGLGQALLLVTGAGLAGLGWLGRKRMLAGYSTGAVILANTLALCVFVELSAIVLTRLGLFAGLAKTVHTSKIAELPYYAAQPWSTSYWRETGLSENYEYTSFNGWHRRPFRGETVNVGADYRRVTPGSECSPNSFTIFAFGGSTMWGWGAPDWETIPAHLLRELTDRVGRPICMVNYGEDGYVSTQEVVLLMKELQRGVAPDAVIFYDGVNDVTAAYVSQEAGNHVRLDAMKLRLEHHPLAVWLRQSRTHWLASNLVRSRARTDLQALENSDNIRVLAHAIAKTYVVNRHLVQGLGEEFGFRSFFFLQPHLAVETKRLTHLERTISERLSPLVAQLARQTYESIAAAAAELPDFLSLADVFAAVDEQVWIDEWGHITPDGNRLIASRIAERISAVLPCDQSSARLPIATTEVNWSREKASRKSGLHLPHSNSTC